MVQGTWSGIEMPEKALENTGSSSRASSRRSSQVCRYWNFRSSALRLRCGPPRHFPPLGGGASGRGRGPICAFAFETSLAGRGAVLVPALGDSASGSAAVRWQCTKAAQWPSCLLSSSFSLASPPCPSASRSSSAQSTMAPNIPQSQAAVVRPPPCLTQTHHPLSSHVTMSRSSRPRMAH